MGLTHNDPGEPNIWKRAAWGHLGMIMIYYDHDRCMRYGLTKNKNPTLFCITRPQAPGGKRSWELVF
jgi:hypothetical protein